MCGMAQMTTSGVHRNIRYYEKCSPERGKQIGGLLHLPILKKQFRIFRGHHTSYFLENDTESY